MIEDKPAHGRYTLRDLTDEDLHWMWPSHCDAMRPWVEPVYGWDEEVFRYFFDRDWPKWRVVQVDGENAGWLELSQEKNWLHLSEIGVLPEYRNKGLGTQVIEDVLAYAERDSLEVELQVLVINPARRLYERLGFKSTHVKMQRKASTAKRASNIELSKDPSHERYGLRKAVSEDAGFVFDLFAECFCSTYEALYGEWDRAGCKASIAFMIREGAHIIRIGGNDAGFFRYYPSTPGRVQLAEMELLPPYRGQGIATQLLSDLIDALDEVGKDIELQILMNNPARRMYERLGFVTTNLLMHRKPNC